MNEHEMTILVVDDEEAVRESLTDHLEDRGFRVLGAENGRVGLDLFERECPDLVLTDLRMPEVDGLELLARVVELSPDTPVLVVSGTGNIADSVQALRRGAWDYILKPIEDLSVVSHSVNNAIERAGLKRENVAQQQRLKRALKQLREDEEAGRNVQMKLLPPSPYSVEPYLLTRHMVPSLGLSGDFVDYFPVDTSHLAFYSADVSGHGISSALVTVLLRSFMRSQFDQYVHQRDDTLLCPDRLLARLNAELLHQQLGKHITIFYAVLDREQNVLSYSSGGQFPFPIMFTRSGPEPLDEHGTAVGLFPDACYETVTRSLEDQFMLAVYSDGILETLPDKSLQSQLAYLQSLDTMKKIETVMAQVETFRDLPDDVAVLTVSKGDDA